MNNFDDFENKNYKEGKKVHYAFRDHAVHFMRLIYFGIKIFLIMFKEIFQSFFFTTQKKDLSGQLALVTGELCGAIK